MTGIKKIHVKEDAMGNVIAFDPENEKESIFIQSEESRAQFFEDVSFSALDEGFEDEEAFTITDAIGEIEKGWTMVFRIGLDMWGEYLGTFGKGE